MHIEYVVSVIEAGNQDNAYTMSQWHFGDSASIGAKVTVKFNMAS